MSNTFAIHFLGTNGSCAYNNGQRNYYGTNTPCVAVKVNETALIFDAGSGICGLKKLSAFQNKNKLLFLSHYHIDHISGLLFWDALFDSGNEINIYGINDVRASLNDFLSTPLNPVGLDAFCAKLNFINIKDGKKIKIEDTATIKSMVYLSHPGGCAGYRVDYCDKSVCYLTDIELGEHEQDGKLTEFINGTDLLIADTGFANGKSIKGWGHSTPNECAELAKRTGVKKLALFHYGHTASDDDIRMLEKEAQAVFSESFASSDGLKIII